MDTEKIILLKNQEFNIADLKIPDLNIEERYVVEFYVEFNRYIQELEMLYKVYKCNLNIMTSHYEIFNDDTIERKIHSNDKDYIEINTLVINFLSSGKTLVESIESFTKYIDNDFSKSNPIDFKQKYISPLYDSCFSYRLLWFLRNYSQHGHLPVSESDGNRYCFDLSRILITPHFNINRFYQDEFSRICEEVEKNFCDYPRIMFKNSLVEYDFCIHSIYAKFWSIMESKYDKAINGLWELLKKKPELVYYSENQFNGYIFYEDSESNIHCFLLGNNPKQVYLNFKKDADSFFEECAKAKEDFKNSIKFKKFDSK